MLLTTALLVSLSAVPLFEDVSAEADPWLRREYRHGFHIMPLSVGETAELTLGYQRAVSQRATLFVSATGLVSHDEGSAAKQLRVRIQPHVYFSERSFIGAYFAPLVEGLSQQTELTSGTLDMVGLRVGGTLGYSHTWRHLNARVGAGAALMALAARNGSQLGAPQFSPAMMFDLTLGWVD